MNQEKIGNTIKQIRIDNNLTQKEFADIFGVTYQAVSKWENGKNLPDISIMKLICDKYNYNLDELLGNEKKPKSKNKNIIFIILFVVIIILIIGLVFFIINHSNFHFGTINSSCDEFKISGSVAYNSSKTSIYISDVKYCGEENNTIYKKIESTLFLSKNNVDKSIYSDSKDNVSLNNYLDNFSMQVNSNICLNFDGELILSIIAYDERDKATIYKIPLSLSDSCSIH